MPIYRGIPPHRLEEHSNVDETTPAVDGQALIYEASSATYKPGQPATDGTVKATDADTQQDVLEDKLVAGNDITITETTGPNGPALQIDSTATLSAVFPLLAPDGSAGTPPYSFSSDTDSGIFLGGGAVQTTVGGSARAQVSATQAEFSVPVNTNSGSAAVPAYTMGDLDTGIFGSDGAIRFSTAGVEQMQIVGASVTVNAPVQTLSGSAVEPSYAFQGNADTGMYAGGADVLRFATAGTERLEIEADGTLNVGGTLNYELLVTNDDDIPNKAYVDSVAGGGGATNLSIGTVTGTTLDIDSSTGTNATVPAATGTDAGLLTAADFTKLGTVETNAAADQDASEVPYTGAAPSNYTPSSADVEGHLAGIDAALVGGGGVSYPLTAPDGTVSAPSYSFANSTNGGMYLSGTDDINFARAGTQIMQFNVNGISASDTVTGVNGSAASVSFGAGAVNRGMYYDGTDLAFAEGGTTHFRLNASAITPDRQMQSNSTDSDPTQPNYSFRGDPNTGLYRIGADIAGIATAGSERMRWEADGTCSVQGVTDYETLVTADDDIPNKKYVDDALANPSLLINGGFAVAQRGTSFAGVTSTAYTLDRWAYSVSGSGVVTVTQDTTEGNDRPFAQHINVDVTTADAAIAASDIYALNYVAEGIDVSQLSFGNTNAADVTISFWHAHTVAGTYSLSLRNAAANRSYIATYTQSVSDAWEQATVTVPGDVAGTWLKGEAEAGLRLSFVIAAGTTFHGSAGSWLASNSLSTAASVNGMGTIGNNFRLGNVKMEVGSTATAFIQVPMAAELAACQRYYEKSYSYTTAVGTATNLGSESAGFTSGQIHHSYSFLVAKRAPPTMRFWSLNGTLSQITVNDVTNEALGSGSVVSDISTSRAKARCSPTTSGIKIDWQWDADSEL